MSTFPEQLTAVSKSQVAAQLAYFQHFSAEAVAGTEKMIALNLSTTRASMEKSAAAVRQLLTVKDPRDLLSFTTQAQEQLDTMLAWGRDLLNIASGTQAALFKPAMAGDATPSAAPLPALTAPAEPFPAAAAVKPVARAAAVVADAAAPEAVAADVAELEAALDEAQSELIAPKPRRKK